MGPFSKGVAAAVFVLLIKVCIGWNIYLATTPDRWVQMLEVLYLVTLTTDFPVMLTTVLIFSKGNFQRMIVMCIGFLGTYMFLGWLIYEASKKATDIRVGNDYFF